MNYSLWYEQPASDWNEALPLGNGRLGMMVFGLPGFEKLQINEDSIWSGFFRDRNNPEAKDALPAKSGARKKRCSSLFVGCRAMSGFFRQPDILIFRAIRTAKPDIAATSR